MITPPPSDFNLLKDVGVPLLTLVLGGLGALLFMSAKDRRDAKHKRFEETRTLEKDHNEAAVAYQAALVSYVSAADATLENFFAISTTGETYFRQLSREAAAIKSGLVDPNLRDSELIPAIERACLETLPDHYATLKKIADQKGYAFDAVPSREVYGLLYAVVEKWGTRQDLICTHTQSR
jgi:hypothetical protein